MSVSFFLIRGTVATIDISDNANDNSLVCAERTVEFGLLQRLREHYDSKENLGPGDLTRCTLLNAISCNFIAEVWFKPHHPYVRRILYAKRVDPVGLTESEMSIHKFPKPKPTQVFKINDVDSINKSTKGIELASVDKIRTVLNCFLDDPETEELTLSFLNGNSLETQKWVKV
jgi:hypothetical protein